MNLFNVIHRVTYWYRSDLFVVNNQLNHTSFQLIHFNYLFIETICCPYKWKIKFWFLLFFDVICDFVSIFAMFVNERRLTGSVRLKSIFHYDQFITQNYLIFKVFFCRKWRLQKRIAIPITEHYSVHSVVFSLHREFSLIICREYFCRAIGTSYALCTYNCPIDYHAMYSLPPAENLQFDSRDFAKRLPEISLVRLLPSRLSFDFPNRRAIELDDQSSLRCLEMVFGVFGFHLLRLRIWLLEMHAQLFCIVYHCKRNRKR